MAQFEDGETDLGIWAISAVELSRNDSISPGQGLSSEAGQGDLKGVWSQASRIFRASSGEVDIPDRESTLQLLMERVLTASATVVQVDA